MAFSTNGLIMVQQGGATAAGREKIMRRWMYATDDAAAVVEAANYFNGAATLLTKGDIIEASMVRAGTPVGKHYIVTAIAAGVVSVVVFA